MVSTIVCNNNCYVCLPSTLYKYYNTVISSFHLARLSYQDDVEWLVACIIGRLVFDVT